MATLEATDAMIPGTRLREGASDAFVMTKRSLLHIPRVPELLVFSTIQPIMFVLLFAYVFGGAIDTHGHGSYREYLLAGVFVQTVAFASASTAVGLAEDMQRGLIDRFKSLPMARSAVLLGRTFADLVRNVFICAIMAGAGYIVGWRVRDGALKALAAFALILLFAYAMMWVGALIGLSVSNAETANTAGFIWLFPVTFLSNAFAPIGTMPTFLQHVATWNPVSATVQAARELFGNPAIAPPSHSLPVDHPILVSVGWSILLLAVFIPWSVRKYARVSGG
jgi:ABC transporter DrrB family efflux protein